MTETPSTISVDNPGSVDTLGRVAFARHLLELAMRVDAESRGAVIGLEGSWGTGKTSVFNSLDPLLEDVPEGGAPILIRFNPWVLSGTSQLVEALLLQMSAALTTGTERPWWHLRRFRSQATALTSSLIDYASVLSTLKYFAPMADVVFPGSGHAVGLAASSAGALSRLKRRPSKLSLSDARARVEKLLAALSRRIIILVDDIDRLPPTELVSMIQAVKAVADFPNVVYVVAYDPEVAARAIQAAIQTDGRAFLEKIIQVPLALPAVPLRRFNAFAIGRLEDSVHGARPSAQQQNDLNSAWGLAAALMNTPRDVERLRTRLLVATPVLRDEVNLADVVLLESLSFKAPTIVQWIKDNVPTVIGGGLSEYDPATVARGDLGDRMDDAVQRVNMKKEELDKIALEWNTLLPVTARARVPVANAMAFLFDKCKPKWSDASPRSNYRRVQDYRFWYRWLCYHDHQEPWSATEIAAFLRRPTELLAAGIHLDDEFRGFCQQVCDIGVDSFDGADSAALVSVYAQAEEALGIELMTKWDVGLDPLTAFAIAVRLDEPTQRRATFEHLISQVSVWLSGRLVLTAWAEVFKPAAGEVPAEKRLIPSDEDLEAVVATWCAKANELIDSESWASPAPDLDPYVLLSWMEILGRDPSEIRALAVKFIGPDGQKLSTFFQSLSSTPARDMFPIDVKWHVLPNVPWLLKTAEASDRFATTHPRFVAAIRAMVKSQEKLGLVQGASGDQPS